jgi:acetylornithine deacetylase/succinyl-diaminopimelate desuccinylase-like protein
MGIRQTRGHQLICKNSVTIPFNPLQASVSEILACLVRTPSLNPDAVPDGPNSGEERIARLLAGWLEDAGADVSMQEVRPGRSNVLAYFPGSGPKPRILFAPHMDTVGVEGMTVSPFAAECFDGRMFGRGTSDAKGTMAAMLAAIFRNREILGELSHEIWFSGLVGEEVGQIGSRALATREQFDLVIAGEPTQLKVVHATKGTARLTLRSPGLSAHGSTPERGINAITRLLPAINFLDQTLAPEFAAMGDAILGAPTLNIGSIRGGIGANVVPDLCEAQVNLRTIPGQSLDDLPARIRSIAPGVEVELSSTPAFYTDPSMELVSLLSRLGAGPACAPWFCDAAIFAAHGSPAVAAGPGSLDQAHTADEFIDLADLEEGVDFFSRFLLALA